MRLTDTGASYKPARDRVSRARIINIICRREERRDISGPMPKIAGYRERGRSSPFLAARGAAHACSISDAQPAIVNHNRRGGIVIIRNAADHFHMYMRVCMCVC
jgi:hypothetical protein